MWFRLGFWEISSTRYNNMVVFFTKKYSSLVLAQKQHFRAYVTINKETLWYPASVLTSVVLRSSWDLICRLNWLCTERGWHLRTSFMSLWCRIVIETGLIFWSIESSESIEIWRTPRRRERDCDENCLSSCCCSLHFHFFQSSREISNILVPCWAFCFLCVSKKSLLVLLSWVQVQDVVSWETLKGKLSNELRRNTQPTDRFCRRVEIYVKFVPEEALDMQTFITFLCKKNIPLSLFVCFPDFSPDFKMILLLALLDLPWTQTLWCGRQSFLDPTTLLGRAEPSSWSWSSQRTTPTKLLRWNLSQKCSIQTFTTMGKFVWIFCRISGRPFMTFRPFWRVFNRCCATPILRRLPTPKPVDFTMKTVVSTIVEFEKS